jgi:hypothetical protein
MGHVAGGPAAGAAVLTLAWWQLALALFIAGFAGFFVGAMMAGLCWAAGEHRRQQEARDEGCRKTGVGHTS